MVQQSQFSVSAVQAVRYRAPALAPRPRHDYTSGAITLSPCDPLCDQQNPAK